MNEAVRPGKETCGSFRRTRTGATFSGFSNTLMAIMGAAAAHAAALATALRGNMELRASQLAQRPADFYEQVVTRFDGQQVTRLEMIQFVKEHELTHRAQLFVYLRLKGVIPCTTRRRMAK